jgi:S1-C subfamily serine protease
MIPFRCPICQTLLSATPDQVGAKVNCPKCGQRLAVPGDRNKTVLGVLDAPRTDAPPPPARQDYHVVLRQGKQYGPYSAQQLQDMARNNLLVPADQVWMPAARAWVPAPQVKGQVAGAGDVPHGPKKTAFPWRRWVASGAAVAALAAVVLVVVVLLGAGRNDAAAPDKGNEIAKVEPPAPLPQKKAEPPAPPPQKKAEPPAPPAPPKELTLAELVARTEKSVAFIKGPMGTGSGFVVGPNLVATNAHVVELFGVADLQVSFPSAGEAEKKLRHIDRVVYFDRKRDLALIEVPVTLPALKIRQGEPLSRGDKVIAIGSPGLGNGSVLANTISQGINNGIVDIPPDGPCLQLNISINGGNSGGPVLSAAGEVVGMSTMTLAGKEGIALAVPAAAIERAVARAGRLDAQEKDAVSARHDARAVFVRTLPAAKFYTEGAKHISALWLKCLDNRANPVPVIEKFRQSDFALLNAKRQLHRLILKDVDEMVVRVGSDTRLPEETRRQIADLWNSYREAKNAYDNPFFLTLQEYFQRYRNTNLALERLESRLSVTLGVGPNEMPRLP